MSIYTKKDLHKQTLFQKLFHILPKTNYIIELENLLADNEKNILSISSNSINELRNKYKVSEKAYKRERELLLDLYITHCLWDNHLSTEEKNQLNHLCDLIDLKKEYLEKRIIEEGKIIYRNQVQKAISDNKLTDEEEKDLNSLKSEFNLSDKEETDIYTEEVENKIQSYVNTIIANRRVSPEEEKQLNEMITGLNVKVTYTDNGLEKFKKFWKIENGELDEIPSPINLQKSERLFYRASINWYEERTRTTYISYGGLTTNFRIAKGLSLRAGHIAPSRQTEEYMKLIDSGEVFFTNKRIIFMGSHGNKNIPLTKILDITPFSNGIEIGKETGKKPFFECSDSEEMGIMLARLLKDC